MPGFYISYYEDKEFDSHSFRDAKLTEIKVEGRLYKIVYDRKEGTKEPTRLQILRNYENAIKKIGGTVLYSDWDGISFMKLVKDGKEIWVEVSAYMTYQPTLWIVEKGAMVQDIVANSEAFSNDIRATGHAAVYGIYFDTGKSVIKPESEAALKEIAKLLKGNAGLKVHIVGHTDNVGGIEANMKLSQDRANAVVQALVGKHGIPATRLKAQGVGPFAPVASNDTDEGKAKNRRVELVKQ
ncbi:MAG: OmpA family protein [Deltaproteobacteria bacterium]|nr:MAG: OmpA family protein [Deltaproteobacteria bacterium]